MTSKIITTTYQRLDFLAKSFDADGLDEGLTKAWEDPLPSPADSTFLRWWGDTLLLVAAPNGVCEVTGSGLSEIKPLGMAFFQCYPGYDSDAAIVAADGSIFRWKPGSEPVFQFNPHAAGESVVPMGFPDDQLLLTVKRNPLSRLLFRSAPWVTEFVNGGRPRIKWSDPEFLRTCLPGDRGIFLNYGLDSPKVLYTTLGHQPIWRCEMDATIEEIIAQVNDVLWVKTEDGALGCIDTIEGRIIRMMHLPNAANPLCTVDEKGRIVICNGAGITVIDGASGAIVVEKQVVIRNGWNSGSVRGHEVVVTRDDQVIFFDHYNRVFRVPLLTDEPGTFLWEAPERIRGIAVLGDRLVLHCETAITGLVKK